MACSCRLRNNEPPGKIGNGNRIPGCALRLPSSEQDQETAAPVAGYVSTAESRIAAEAQMMRVLIAILTVALLSQVYTMIDVYEEWQANQTEGR